MSDDCDYGMDHLGQWRLITVITEWTTLGHDVWWLWLWSGPHWTMTSDDWVRSVPPWTMTFDYCDYGVDLIGPWYMINVIIEWTTLDHDVWWLSLRNGCTTLDQDVWRLWFSSGPHWITTSYECDYGVDHLGPRRLMTVIFGMDHHGPWHLMAVITQWTTLDHDIWWLWLYRGLPWTMMYDDHDYIGGPPCTMMSDGCDYRWRPHWTMTSDDHDYGLDRLNHEVWWCWLRSGPHWTMTYVYCDYGVDHLGPWRMMVVITYGDHLGLWRLLTMITDGDHHWPWRLMTVITEWTTLDHDVWWLWLRNGPHWTMTYDGCDYAVNHHGPRRLMNEITEWITLDHDIWWL